MANISRKEFNRAIAEWSKFPDGERLRKVIKFVERSFINNTPLYFPIGGIEDVMNLELGSYRMLTTFYDDGELFLSFANAIHVTPNDWLVKLNDRKFYERDSEVMSYFSGYLKVKDIKLKDIELSKINY